MNFEKEIFKRAIVDFPKLEKYGFKKIDDKFIFNKKIIDDTFRVDVYIDKNGNVEGKIFELDISEEYTNFRIENQNGEFVNSIREEYLKILKDILDNCFTKKYFVTDQANAISEMVIAKYHNEPEFLWDDLSSGVFRNTDNKKWYGIIMNVDRSKLTSQTGEVEVLNVKLDEEKIKSLLKQKGYYTCYHMNKQKWISIILDGTLPNEVIMDHIIESHGYTEKSAEWLIPANPKYYDVIGAFDKSSIVDWKQSSDVHVGDNVYMYVASPYSAILYKCRAKEVNIPCTYEDENISIKKMMRLELLKKYDQNEYNLEKLIDYGIKSVRGPRYMPQKLINEMHKKEEELIK